MPAIYFHYLTYDLLLDKKDPYRLVGLLGSQGPDPLYYYGHGLSHRSNVLETRKMGNRFHHEKIADYLAAMYEFASRRDDEKERDVLYAYIQGYLFHYFVDRNAHPYIFYRSGFSTPKDENDVKYQFLHSKFESSLDIAISKRYKLKRINPALLIIVKRRYLRLISEMYYFVSQKVFYPCNYFNKKSFYRAYKDYKFAYRISYSKFGTKKNFFEKKFKYSMVNSISHPLTIEEDIDYLNLKHSTWRDPVNGTYNDLSIIDMIENAKREFETSKQFREIKDKSVLKNRILRLVKDTDFDGGKIGSKKIYFSLYKEGLF